MNRRRLIDYLKKFKERVKVEKFDISDYTSNEQTFHFNLAGELSDHNCGTAACGVGYLPILYPRTFEFNGYTPVLKKGSVGVAGVDSRKFFDINTYQWAFLFGADTEWRYPEFGKGKDGLINRIEHLLKNNGLISN